MENASKALLIAGGVALTILMVTLLIFTWGRFSSFYNSEDSLKEVEDVAKFNSQFTAYNRGDVHGYELISLANKVADYNNRYSNAENAQNDIKYSPITMTFTITTAQEESLRFSRNTVDAKGNIINSSSIVDRLFKKQKYTQSAVLNEIRQYIIDPANEIEEVYGGTAPATRLAKSINSLILTKEQLDHNKNYKNMEYWQSKMSAIDDYNRLTGDNKIIDYADKTKVEVKYVEMYNILTSKANIMKYYEFYQFKRGIFNCTGVTYDSVTNRVSTMNFEFTGVIE